MAKKGKQRATATSPDHSAKQRGAAERQSQANPLTSLPSDPPRRHQWFLIASIFGVAGWMLFLLVMGLRG